VRLSLRPSFTAARRASCAKPPLTSVHPCETTGLSRCAVAEKRPHGVSNRRAKRPIDCRYKRPTSSGGSRMRSLASIDLIQEDKGVDQQ